MTVFFIIGGAGILLLVLALVLGDLFEGVLSLDALDALDGLDALDSDIFSTAGIAGLLGGFGFGGALGLGLTGNMVIAIVVGLAIGVLLGWMAGKLTSVLRRQGADVAPSTKSLIGVEALVITAVPQDGYGQVRINHRGHTYMMNAKAPVPLDPGARVWVSGVLSATSVEVTPVDALGSGSSGILEA